MLVTFHSNAYENITYFGEVAKQLLQLMGHSGTIPGAIKSKDVPDALNRLKNSLAKSNDSDREDDDGEVAIGLAKRAIPLINLLQASIKDDCDVLWDA